MKLDAQDHQALALWAADCAAHVLHLFEERQPGDDRPRTAIDAARAWVRGAIGVGAARTAAFDAHAAAREATEPAALATARSAGHAAAAAHMAAHARHAAEYAAAATGAAAAPGEAANIAEARERAWQAERLPVHLRAIGMPDGAGN